MNEPTRYLALCLDPVHVGTGGYRLGRVDMSIVRDPATGIPKIPGTSLAGAVRAYAELAKAEDNSLPDINEVFGTAEGDQGKQGMLRFYDAEIVLFPVSSHLGTVWVTTAERLTEWLDDASSGGEKLSIPNGLQDENKVFALRGLDAVKPVHLGWLLLEAEGVKGASTTIRLPTAMTFAKRLVLVSDKLFYHLVNDHLEVRTSVGIDDVTGAAKDRALFTYEAIPRGTVIGFEVAIDSRRGGNTPEEHTLQLLRKAFATLKLLGVGGMGTRGFGRIEVLNDAQEARAARDAAGGH
ncbi:MAG: type III-B CRISPR module RAMP protein Cmr4 [Chloroflexi bacterium]|nr:type III-B CRISPR module RAMP protein Cmr4 [Chloroflexota bacterium]